MSGGIAAVGPVGRCATADPCGGSDTHTTEAGEIVGGLRGQRWGYRVARARRAYQDRSPSGPLEPGTILLRAR